MVQATFHFPKGFLWGAATSAHQVEGYNTNNQWWAWEQQPGRIQDGDKSGEACGWWGGRWRDDFDRAAEAGQNAHRFSIEWSRVQPVPTHWDETAVDRYREMGRRLKDRKMTALVTLHHFSDPLWISEDGGWENPSIVDRFAAYTRKIVESLNEYVSLWITINEPNVYACASYLTGEFPPGEHNLKKTGRVLVNMARAHAAAYCVIKELQPKARVGVAHHYHGLQPANRWSPADWLAVRAAQLYFNDSFPNMLMKGVLKWPFFWKRMPEVIGTQDFFGLNYYTEEKIHFNLSAKNYYQGEFEKGAQKSSDGVIANVPQGLFRAIEWSRKFKMPILVTENGIDDREDLLRPGYLVEHIHQVWRAINFNYPIEAYFHWSLVDNFEWHSGWSRRFGLWKLDLDTQKRTKRLSAELYAEICHANAISSEVVARYTPELVEKLFPE